MATVDLSVIIVSYNVRDFLEQCLLSLRSALQGIPHEIWVVDNASRDGSQGMVHRRFPEVKLIENAENAGFARANNQALRHAAGRFICLLNPDTLVKKDTFQRLLEFMDEHPEAGMVGCKILNPDGSLQLACRRSYPTPWVAFTRLVGLSYLFPRSRLFGRYNLTYLSPDEVHEVEAISGSFMLFRREALEQVGLLDEAFFMYGEDLDFCYRFRAAGWKIYYVPTTQVVHFKGESWKRSELDRLRHFYQAMRLFVRKHFHRRYGIAVVTALTLAIWVRAALSLLARLLRRVTLPLIDLALMNLSLALGQLLRFGGLMHFRSYLLVDLVYSSIWLLCLYGTGLYGRYRLSVVRAGWAVLMGLFINATFTYFFKQYAFSRAVVLYAGVFNLLFLTGWRALALWWPPGTSRQHEGRRAFFGRRTLIVGDACSGRAIVERLHRRADGLYDIAGLVTLVPEEVGDKVAGVPVIGTLDHLADLIRRERAEEVVFATDKISHDQILTVIDSAAGTGASFKLVADDFGVIIGKASIDRIDEVPMVELDYKLLTPPNPALKRGLDLVVAMLLLGVGALPYVLGKLFWSRGRRPLAYVDANGRSRRRVLPGSGPRWFRNFPLLVDVLLGRLSFVGREIEEDPRADGRVRVKPGLTGLVQLYGGNQLSEDERERYHLYYLRNYSLLLDVEILLRALFGQGSRSL
ncbi:MAG: glycosyltransferase [candidate division KSB1 bacterium]|nr:glycosyltransferase [candidate division KSB1 bacterium]